MYDYLYISHYVMHWWIGLEAMVRFYPTVQKPQERQHKYKTASTAGFK